jgi:thiol:disulfide interchange protein/DsbC/DsbD-like thiol-disulfide interchange protein
LTKLFCKIVPVNTLFSVLLVLCVSLLGSSEAARAQSTTTVEPPKAAVSGPVRVDFVEVELVANVLQANPSQPLLLGLRIKHDLHWHTYWKNSGDSGLPTQMAWTAAPGWKIGPTQWPTPERIGVAHLANYGFEGEIVLPVDVRAIDSTATKTGLQRFEVNAQWLACKEVCIPGEAKLMIELPATAGAIQEPNQASKFAALFAAMDKITAKGNALVAKVYVNTSVIFNATASNSTATKPTASNPTASNPTPSNPTPSNPKVTLLISHGLPEATLQAAKLVEFFPAIETWVSPAAPQPIVIDGKNLRIDLTLTENAAKPTPEQFKDLGVLQIDQQYFAVTATSVDGVAPALSQSPSKQWLAVVAKQVDMTPTKTALLDRLGKSAADQPVATNQAASLGSSLGLFAALGFAFVGGLLLNLMPCVLPVLSIKLLSLAEAGAKRKRDGWLFSLGVVVSFALLGVLLWALRSAGEAVGWGFQLQSPLLVAVLAIVFLLLSLNLFGVFEIGTGVAQLASSPAGKTTAISVKKADGSSALSAVGAGVLAVVAATPCSAPFMGSAMGYALGQPVYETLAVFLALGIGMALPFLLATQLPWFERRIPKPGAWMVAFKQVLAFPLLATVAWLVWVFGQQTSMDAVLRLLIAFIALGWIAWLWGRKQYGHQRKPLLAGVSASILAGLTAWLVFSAANLVQIDAPASANTKLNSEAFQAGQWQPYSPEVLESALAQGQAVFVDFTAAWCVSCQVNKKAVLETDSMKQFFTQRKVVLLRADWTKRDPAITKALAAYGRNSIPVYASYKAGSRQVQLLPELLTAATVEQAY